MVWFCTRCVSACIWAYRQTSASICTHNFLTAKELTLDQQWILSPACINERSDVFILSDPKYINISYTESNIHHMIKILYKYNFHSSVQKRLESCEREAEVIHHRLTIHATSCRKKSYNFETPHHAASPKPQHHWLPLAVPDRLQLTRGNVK